MGMKETIFNRFVVLFFLGVFCSFVLCQDKPNILFFITDDVGWADLGFTGSPTTRTVNLDKLAANGMRFNQFYAGESICSPSRGAMLTGRYPIRSGIYSKLSYPWDNLFRVFYPWSTGSLPSSEITIADLLKNQSYNTAMIGKWHLGHVNALPTDRGFDYFYGLPYAHDEGCPPGYNMSCTQRWQHIWPPVPLFRNEEIIQQPVDLQTIVTRYSMEASAFIEKSHKEEKPFFMVVSYEEAHIPIFAGPNFEGKSLRGLYGDAIMEMDNGVGTIIKKLEDLKIDSNTLIFFTSDNGAWIAQGLSGGTNGVFFGQKGTTWEGGYRVPTIAYWPGKIAKGTVNMDITCMMDLFTTAVIAGGAEVPTDRIIDGKNLLPTLINSTSVPRECFFLYRSKYLQAARCGSYKAHFITRSGFGTAPPIWHNPPILFNINQDPGERYPLNNETFVDYYQVINLITDAVARHNSTLVPGVSQLDKIDPLVAPCCSHLSKCTCGHEGGIPSHNSSFSSSSSNSSYASYQTLDLSLLFDDNDHFVFNSLFKGGKNDYNENNNLNDLNDLDKNGNGDFGDLKKFHELYEEASDLEIRSIQLYGW